MQGETPRPCLIFAGDPLADFTAIERIR
jgi:hypothetical protein